MTRGYLGSTPDGGIDDADREPVPPTSKEQVYRAALERIAKADSDDYTLDWAGAVARDALARASAVETGCEFALRGLYWDQVDYLTLNKLGGMNNHWMRAAREALGMDPNDMRPTQDSPPKTGEDA